MKIQDLQPKTETFVDRPEQLGKGYFWINGKLQDIHPHRNHRAWLQANSAELNLPDHVKRRPASALWEGYKTGVVRLVWNPGEGLFKGNVRAEGNSLYLNGFEQDIWRNIQGIMNHPYWAGNIATVVCEYVEDKNNKPDWTHNEVFKNDDLENLYRGRRPRTARRDQTAMWGGDDVLKEGLFNNKMMNILNDHSSRDIFEMFNSHMMTMNLSGNNFGTKDGRKKILNAPNDIM